MNRAALNQALCALVTTLAEVDHKEAPEGVLYAGLLSAGCESDVAMGALSLAVAGKLVTREAGPVLRLTARGAEIAAQVEAHVAAVKGGAR